MVAPFTVPVEMVVKSVASTPVTESLKTTVKAALVVAEAPLLPVLVLIEITVGNAGEKGTAGVILCSRLMSSSRCMLKALRAFLFCELQKRLRKVLSIRKVPNSIQKKGAIHRVQQV
jgi:hypothetical protein